MAKLQKTETGARVFTTTVADDNSAVTFTFGAESLTVNVADYSPAIAARLTCHGIVQKIGDSKTGAKRDDYNSVAEWHAAQWAQLNATAEMVANGDWSKRGDGEATGNVAGIRFTAYSNVMARISAERGATPPTSERLRELFDARVAAKQYPWNNEQVSAEIERIKLARASASGKSVDVDALFAELE